MHQQEIYLSIENKIPTAEICLNMTHMLPIFLISGNIVWSPAGLSEVIDDDKRKEEKDSPLSQNMNIFLLHSPAWAIDKNSKAAEVL